MIPGDYDRLNGATLANRVSSRPWHELYDADDPTCMEGAQSSLLKPYEAEETGTSEETLYVYTAKYHFLPFYSPLTGHRSARLSSSLCLTPTPFLAFHRFYLLLCSPIRLALLASHRFALQVLEGRQGRAARRLPEADPVRQAHSALRTRP